MNRYEQAVAYHHKGFNCCQSVLAAYSDLTGLSQQASFDMGGGFGAGAHTGELCGAITGAILTLGMLTPVDPLAKEFQKRFQEKFGDLRCKPLLKAGIQATDATPVARDMALTNRCDVLIITAMEIVEEMRGENA